MWSEDKQPKLSVVEASKVFFLLCHNSKLKCSGKQANVIHLSPVVGLASTKS